MVSDPYKTTSEMFLRSDSYSGHTSDSQKKCLNSIHRCVSKPDSIFRPI